MGLFDDIRFAVKRASTNSRHVFINHSSLHSYAKSLNFAEIIKPVYDSKHHLLADEDSTLAYIIILNTINFGSGYFPVLKKNEGMSGYFTIAYNLKEYFLQDGSPSPQDLANISIKEICQIFKQDDKQQIIELMQLFATALNDLGKFVQTNYGSYKEMLLAANNSAERLAEILTKMPLFQDEYIYNGKRLPIYKRAQIMASDLALAFDNKAYGYFEDLDKLTIFADNLVPHVLRLDGVLKYSPSLVRKLESGELLKAGSEEESEIRALSLHACELT